MVIEALIEEVWCWLRRRAAAGEPEWGAAVYAASPEAVFVSMIDHLDAKMGMVQRALRQASDGDDFSERLPGLSSPLLTRKLPVIPPAEKELFPPT